MNYHSLVPCLIVALTLLGAIDTALAQRYKITKHTIDAGGGTSSGGKYSNHRNHRPAGCVRGLPSAASTP